MNQIRVGSTRRATGAGSSCFTLWGPCPARWLFWLGWGATRVPGPPLKGLFRYGESELEPAIQAEILLESARNEARVAVLELCLALLFTFWYGFGNAASQAIAWFSLITVLPLLVDSQLRRAAARRLLGVYPHPPKKAVPRPRNRV